MAAFTRASLVVPALCGVLALAGAGSPAASTSPDTPTVASIAQPSGAWPAPVDRTFNGCPPGGDGGDHALNVRKNRIDSGTWQPDTVSALVHLRYPQSVVRQARSTWSASDAATVARSEGRPLQIEGYMLLVRHEGTESPNCHDPSARDFHMWLAGAPGTLASRASAMIVEVTPRSRALNSGWAPDSRLLALSGKHVRISGWLLLDQEHPEQVGKTRGTLWEIHPVMKIEVEQNGQWRDLDDASLTLRKSSSTHSSGATTGGGRKSTHKRRSTGR